MVPQDTVTRTRDTWLMWSHMSVSHGDKKWWQVQCMLQNGLKFKLVLIAIIHFSCLFVDTSASSVWSSLDFATNFIHTIHHIQLALIAVNAFYGLEKISKISSATTLKFKGRVIRTTTNGNENFLFCQKWTSVTST